MINVVSILAKESASSSLSYAGFDMNVGLGDILYLILSVPQSSDTITSVATNPDTTARTNVWTEVKSFAGTSATAGSIGVWTTTVTTAGFIHIDINSSAFGVGISAVLIDASGSLPTVEAFGSNNGVVGTQHPVTSNSFTTTNPNELWLAITSTNDNPGAFSALVAGDPNNWTQAAVCTGSTSGMPMAVDYQIRSATTSGSVMGGTSCVNFPAAYTGAIVAFGQYIPPSANPAAILQALPV